MICSKVFWLRIPALATAIMSTIALAFSYWAGTSCDFIRVVSFPNPLTITIDFTDDINPGTGDTEFEDINFHSIGIFCKSNLYQTDKLWNLSRAFLGVAFSIGFLTVALAWSIALIVPPNGSNWKFLSIASACSAVLQIPVFLIFDSSPCTVDIDHTCKIRLGCFLLACSCFLYISVTVLTQWLDPPRWATEANSWKVKNHSELLYKSMTEGMAWIENSRNKRHFVQLTNAEDNEDIALINWDEDDSGDDSSDLEVSRKKHRVREDKDAYNVEEGFHNVDNDSDLMLTFKNAEHFDDSISFLSSKSRSTSNSSINSKGSRRSRARSDSSKRNKKLHSIHSIPEETFSHTNSKIEKQPDASESDIGYAADKSSSDLNSVNLSSENVSQTRKRHSSLKSEISQPKPAAAQQNFTDISKASLGPVNSLLKVLKNGEILKIKVHSKTAQDINEIAQALEEEKRREMQNEDPSDIAKMKIPQTITVTEARTSERNSRDIGKAMISYKKMREQIIEQKREHLQIDPTPAKSKTSGSKKISPSPTSTLTANPVPVDTHKDESHIVESISSSPERYKTGEKDRSFDEINDVTTSNVNLVDSTTANRNKELQNNNQAREENILQPLDRFLTPTQYLRVKRLGSSSAATPSRAHQKDRNKQLYRGSLSDNEIDRIESRRSMDTMSHKTNSSGMKTDFEKPNYSKSTIVVAPNSSNSNWNLADSEITSVAQNLSSHFARKLLLSSISPTASNLGKNFHKNTSMTDRCSDTNDDEMRAQNLKALAIRERRLKKLSKSRVNVQKRIISQTAKVTPEKGVQQRDPVLLTSSDDETHPSNIDENKAKSSELSQAIVPVDQSKNPAYSDFTLITNEFHHKSIQSKQNDVHIITPTNSAGSRISIIPIEQTESPIQLEISRIEKYNVNSSINDHVLRNHERNDVIEKKTSKTRSKSLSEQIRMSRVRRMSDNFGGITNMSRSRSMNFEGQKLSDWSTFSSMQSRHRSSDPRHIEKANNESAKSKSLLPCKKEEIVSQKEKFPKIRSKSVSEEIRMSRIRRMSDDSVGNINISRSQSVNRALAQSRYRHNSTMSTRLSLSANSSPLARRPNISISHLGGENSIQTRDELSGKERNQFSTNIFPVPKRSILTRNSSPLARR